MPKLNEKIFVIAMLFYVTGAVLPFLADTQDRATRLEGDPFQFALQSIFYAGAFWFMAIHWRTVLNGAYHAKWIICLIVVAIASTMWSQDPAFTLRRTIVLVATTAFGIYFGSRFSVAQQLRLLAWTFAFVVLSSFAIAIFLPRYGVDHFLHPGDWQGAFGQKNMLARIMVLSAMVFYFVRPQSGNTLRWLGLAGAFVLLVLSRSVTGALVFCAVVATIPLYRLLRTKITAAIPIVVGVVLAVLGSGVIIANSLPAIFQLLNRSPQLTGRTELWNAVVMAIMKRPLIGYGFNAFWQGMTGASATVMLTVQWLPLHSHNGFLDLMLDLGLLGLVTFALGYFALWRRAIKLTRTMRGPVPVWLCTYLLFMFVYNLTESSILVENNICWVLYTATAVNLFLDVPDTVVLEEATLDYGR